MPLLEQIKSPQDIKKFSFEELTLLAQEIRQEIIRVTSRSGGHLSSSLGAVELILTLHYLLDAPQDKIIWDVGHQAYAHKLITGRFPYFDSLRQFGGLSGFPNKDESPYDIFTVGHGSTAISQALGLAAARDLSGSQEKIVAVVGDGSLQGGMAFEALNQVGHLGKNIMVILNDNEWFISPGVGAVSKYLNRILTNPIYNRVHKDVENLMKRIPRFGFKAYRAARRLEEGLKNVLVPGILFEELGFRYFGPMDGHDLKSLIPTIKSITEMAGPRLVHVVTKKGKGCRFTEEDPTRFHSASPFDISTGDAVSKDERPAGQTFTQKFAQTMLALAERNPRIVAVTAAMPDGTGLADFARRFQNRFFDVGMAEQHAVTFAGGLAKGGFIPVVAIYSTFLQRAYDQIVHDVCLQNLHVVFCLDRAGVVGEDGPTHQGVFDLSYLTHIPNMTVMAPRDAAELEKMLEFAVGFSGAVAIRYPKADASAQTDFRNIAIEFGKAEVLKEGKDLAVLALGSMVYPALEVRDLLSKEGIDISVINMRFAKPLDGDLLKGLISRFRKFVTLEENVLAGGFGVSVRTLLDKFTQTDTAVFSLGLPDEFIPHGKREILLEYYGLSPERIKRAILSWLEKDPGSGLGEFPIHRVTFRD
jgi:1-deoxy-D-xylulose-5-phosphate synthase